MLRAVNKQVTLTAIGDITEVIAKFRSFRLFGGLFHQCNQSPRLFRGPLETRLQPASHMAWQRLLSLQRQNDHVRRIRVPRRSVTGLWCFKGSKLPHGMREWQAA